MEWADWVRGKTESNNKVSDQDSLNYLAIKSGMTINGNMRHSRGTIASSNFVSGTSGYSLDAATGNIETASDLLCGNLHVKAATDDVNLSGATGNAIIGVSTSAQHLAFDANEIMSKSDATTAGTLFLQHNGGTLAVGGGAVGTFRVGSDDGTSHKSVASFSHGGHAAPSITFNSDLDTGFFRESANTIGSTGNFTMSKTGSSATLTVSTFNDAPGTESIIVLRSADNTLASPALRDTGDNLGEIHFSGHDGTDYAVGAKISVAASAATGDNDMGATIKLQTTPDGSTTPTTRLAIDHVGRTFLTAASADSAVDLDAVSGDLLVGTVDGGDQHIAMSDQIIQVKTDGTTAGNLFIQNSGGNLTLGAASTTTTFSGIVDITNATDATDATGDTGALRLEGGASIANKLYVGTDLDVDGTSNLDVVDIDGAVQIDNTVTVGVDDTGYNVKFFGATAGHYMQWDQTNNRALVVGGSGQIGVNVTVPVSALEVASDDDLATFESNDRGALTLTNNQHDTNDHVAIDFRHSFATTGVGARIAAKMTGGGSNLLFGTSNSYGGVTNTAITIDQLGAVTVHGALSKGSGTFDIPHPTRNDPWRLRHSFIEGPKADLLYRGTATIAGSGSIAIDLDTVSGLTAGTWQALNQDPWSMVTSSGNAVTWALSGKTLTITGPAGAVCQWMVIGERRDQTVIDWEATDSDGHLITEYDSTPAESDLDQRMKV